MKWITHILLALISTLAFIPCNDGMVHLETIEQSSHKHAEHKPSSHDHEDHEDLCTPFCSCACCGSVVTLTNSFIDFNMRIDLKALYQFPFVFDYSFEYTSHIWHPPILS